MTAAIDYSAPGPMTQLGDVDPAVLDGIPDNAVGICWPVHTLVVQPDEARTLGLVDERFAENQLRPARELVDVLLALDSAPLHVPRAPQRRVVGTCRHFAVLSCALLRHRKIPARVRCGFATYFQAGRSLDHWITEYVHEGRWVRIDSEILGGSVLDRPEELRAGEFLTGGEAWTAYREGRVDAATFGVYGTDNWGPAEIRGNAVKDLAALNKYEMLPWDEWGRMTASYDGKTGREYDELMDAIAAVCADDDSTAVAALYGTEDLAVPADLIH